MGHPGPHRAKRAKDPGHGLDEARVIDPQYLAPGGGRIGERAEQVKHGAEAQFGPDGQDMAHGPVVGGSEQETDAGLVQGAALLARIGRDIDPQRRQHIRGARA